MRELETLTLAFAAATDIGCQRTNNEDSFGYDIGNQLYVVCDGVGGSEAGEIASSTAVRVLIEAFEARSMAFEGGSMQPLENRLLHAVQEANQVVHELAQQHGKAMGSTLVCACLEGARMLIGNVGDSRAYLVRGGACVQITQDHSLVEEQVRSGMMTPEAAAGSSLQSVITRAIGASNAVEPDFFAAELRANDVVLLATDGLTRYLSTTDLASVASSPWDLPAMCKHLIEVARQLGGADNITCMTLRAIT